MTLKSVTSNPNKLLKVFVHLHICLGNGFFCFIYCGMFDIIFTFILEYDDLGPTTQWNSPATVSCNHLEDQMNDIQCVTKCGHIRPFENGTSLRLVFSGLCVVLLVEVQLIMC